MTRVELLALMAAILSTVKGEDNPVARAEVILKICRNHIEEAGEEIK